MPVAIYIRVSSDKQREKHTIETQREEILRYCKLNGIADYRIYADDGVTSKIPIHRRPEGAKLIRDALNKKFEMVLVYRIDRFARTVLENLNLAEFLKKNDVAFRSITEPFENETLSGQLFLILLSWFAQHERESIRQRSMDGSWRNAREGKLMGGRAPYGYILKDREWFIAKDEAAVVRRIFAEYIKGKSCFQIAEELTQSGSRPRVSKQWSAVTVLSMIRNESYAGRRAYGKRKMGFENDRETYTIRPEEERVYIDVPAIINQETWEAAQRQRETNSKFSKRNTKRSYALSGLIKCGTCGYSYCGHTSVYKGRDYRYYGCGSATAPAIRKKCGNLQVKAEQLEEAVWGELSDFLRNPQSVVDQVMRRVRASRGKQHDIEEEIARIDRETENWVSARNRVVGSVAKGIFTDDEAMQEMEEIRASIERLRSERIALLERAASTKENEDKLRDTESVLREIGKSVENANAETKSRIMRRLVEQIEIFQRTSEEGSREIRAEVTYRFSAPSFANYDYNSRPL